MMHQNIANIALGKLFIKLLASGGEGCEMKRNSQIKRFLPATPISQIILLTS